MQQSEHGAGSGLRSAATPHSPHMDCYRALVDVSPDPALVLSDHRVYMANESARELLEIGHRPLDDLHPLDFVHEDFHRLTHSRFLRLMRSTGRLPSIDITLRTRTGNLVPVSSSSTVVSIGDERAILAIVKDLRPSRDAENHLADSENRFASVVRLSPLGMHLYRLGADDSLVLTDLNPASSDILGVDSSSLVGLPIEAAFPGLADTDIPRIYREVARGGAPWNAGQVEYDEGSISGAYEVCAFNTGPGTMAVMFSDVTDRLRKDAELALYRTELERLLKERTARLDEVRSELDAVTAIAGHTVEVRDPYTAGHQRRVSKLAVEIARRLDLDEQQVLEIEGAANLHDLGKVAVPAEILVKPARLSPVEYALVKQHPRAGYEILTSVKADWPIAEMVLQHHERMDGSGYPSGLVGDDILLGARVLAVADVVEAMASHRPYRPAAGEQAALVEISSNSGVLYDSDVVEACISVFLGGFEFDES